MMCPLERQEDGSWKCPVCEYSPRRKYVTPPRHLCGNSPQRPATAPPDHGPGTALKAILSELGIKPTASCGCDAFANQMNVWGPDGCEAHREEILAHLNKAYADLNPSLFDQARMGAKALAMGIIINPFDPAGSLLNAAIERARQDQPAIPPT